MIRATPSQGAIDAQHAPSAPRAKSANARPEPGQPFRFRGSATVYVRPTTDDTVRRLTPKVRGKAARAAEKQTRRLMRERAQIAKAQAARAIAAQGMAPATKDEQ